MGDSLMQYIVYNKPPGAYPRWGGGCLTPHYFFFKHFTINNIVHFINFNIYQSKKTFKNTFRIQKFPIDNKIIIIHSYHSFLTTAYMSTIMCRYCGGHPPLQVILYSFPSIIRPYTTPLHLRNYCTAPYARRRILAFDLYLLITLFVSR